MSELDNQLKKGVLSIIVLKSINEKDMYGYEIMELLDSMSGGFYKLKEGTLYPILYRLQDNKWIESYRVFNEEERKVPRKYYKITKEGQSALQEQIDMWSNFNEITNKLLGTGGKYEK